MSNTVAGVTQLVAVMEMMLLPPHLIRYGKKSWLFQKYGGLELTWEEDLRIGFQECFRVLKLNGVFVFKWNEEQIKLSEILKLCDIEPLFGNKTSKNTHCLGKFP